MLFKFIICFLAGIGAVLAVLGGAMMLVNYL